MLVDNITAIRSLDVDKFQRALLMYRNYIDPETKASPEMILLGRPIRDAIPTLMGRYSPHETWTELMSHREMALAKRHSREHERWNEHTHYLPPLPIGDHVYIQNLVGNFPRRLERTGTVFEEGNTTIEDEDEPERSSFPKPSTSRGTPKSASRKRKKKELEDEDETKMQPSTSRGTIKRASRKR
ncbi:unnamed protein product [Mytilus coruscus]|uniref:Uncharacterized protein n=1 Tax=Mytilus coruscus TaxID=42192 RepID=A0A6J8EUZ5_MYTCO|nr:unnamed protein product [Mytilus coruscus]